MYSFCTSYLLEPVPYSFLLSLNQFPDTPFNLSVLTFPEFAHGKVDPHDAGKKGGEIGGQASGENSGGSSSGEFAHGQVDPVEAGRKGGSS